MFKKVNIIYAKEGEESDSWGKDGLFIAWFKTEAPQGLGLKVNGVASYDVTLVTDGKFETMAGTLPTTAVDENIAHWIRMWNSDDEITIFTNDDRMLAVVSQEIADIMPAPKITTEGDSQTGTVKFPVE